MSANHHVVHWIENVLKKKIRDPEFMRDRLAMLAVAVDRGDSPEKALQMVIMDAVAEAAGMEIKGGHDQQQTRN